MDMLNVYMHSYLLFYHFMSSGIKIDMNAMYDKLKIGRIANLLDFFLDDEAPVDDEKVYYVLGNRLFWHPVLHNKTFINESRLDSL